MQSPAESDYDSELYYYLFETRNIFTSNVLQANEIRYRSRAGVDTIPITFRHFQGYATYDPDLRGYHVDSPNLLLKRTLKLRFSREKASGDAKTRMERVARYKRIIARSPREANKLRNKLGRYLCAAMGLPEDKHRYIIEPFMAKLQSVVPDKPIDVSIMDLTFRDTVESMHMNLDPDDEFFKPNLNPASESFIRALEEASPPDDESCAICREMFALKKDASITHLPCSHYYHRRCIVPWLQINHVCPICRHPNTQKGAS